jgi:hypothetical protein
MCEALPVPLGILQGYLANGITQRDGDNSQLLFSSRTLTRSNGDSGLQQIEFTQLIDSPALEAIAVSRKQDHASLKPSEAMSYRSLSGRACQR